MSVDDGRRRIKKNVGEREIHWQNGLFVSVKKKAARWKRAEHKKKKIHGESD